MSSSSSSKKVIEAATYGSVMGRHVANKEKGSIKFDWPGVCVTFEQVTGTAFIGVVIPMLSGSILGYSVKEYGQEEDSQKVDDEENIISSNLFSQEYMLASDLDTSKTYDVSIWKRDDPALVKVAGLLVDENAVAAEPTSTEQQGLFIEFVGDSDTVGFGNEGRKSGMIEHILLESWFSERTRRLTNAHKSWARHVALALNADHSIVAWSALGATHSPLGFNSMLKVYPRVLATRNSQTTNPEELGPADAVVMYIGQNDQSAVGDSWWGDGETKMSNGFEELVLLIRKHRPNIPIIVVVPTSDCMVACAMTKGERSTMCTVQARVWKKVMEKLGGPEAGYHVVENRHEPQIEFNSKQDFGMCLHWNTASHLKFANALIPKLREIIQTKDPN